MPPKLNRVSQNDNCNEAVVSGDDLEGSIGTERETRAGIAGHNFKNTDNFE